MNKSEWAGVITPTEIILPFYFRLNTGYAHKPYIDKGVFNLLLERQDIAIDTSKATLKKINDYLKTYKTPDYYSKYSEHIGESKFSDDDVEQHYFNTETKEITISSDYKFGVNQNIFLFKGDVSVAKNGKWGMLNVETGKVMIPFEYDIPYLVGISPDGFRYKENTFGITWIQKDRNSIEDTTVFLVVKKQGHYGVIDLTGKVLIPFIYTEIYTSQDCKAEILLQLKKMGYMDC